MRIIFFGTPYFVVPVLESLVQNFEVVGVVTAPDTIQGRKKILTASPIKQYCIDTSQQATILSPQKLNNEAIEQLKSLDPDLFVVASYGKIIPKEILKIPKFGAINIHPSLLPKYRGPSPIQTAILKGDRETGVTIIQMDKELDHGPIVAQWKFPIYATDTFVDLHERMFQGSTEKLPAIITNYVSGKKKPTPQNHSRAVFCGKIEKGDGYFYIDNPPPKETLDRMIRAFYPWPSCWTRLHQDFGGQAKKGTILKLLPKNRVQLEGKNPVPLKQFLAAYPEIEDTIKRLFKELP